MENSNGRARIEDQLKEDDNIWDAMNIKSHRSIYRRRGRVGKGVGHLAHV